METSFREVLTDAIRYWERRRIVYNALLASIVIFVLVIGRPESQEAPSADLVLALFVLAVLANVAYCAAYVVDVAVQHSGFQTTWKRRRWLLFATGVVFAGIVTRFVSASLFSLAL